ncbi:MAG: C1 family peptidase [Planctomycetota bacterium]|jgi:hypothetical protein
MAKSKIITIAICVFAITNSITSAQLPDHFDWRDVNGKNYMSPVKDQGICGSCWAFSAVGTVEAQYNIFWDWPEYDIDLSEEYLVSSCFPNYHCTGGWHYAALNFIKNTGITDEACFPYVDSDCNMVCCNTTCPCTYGCSNATCDEPYRCSAWSDRLWKIDEYLFVPYYNIKNYIYNTGPMAVCMEWGDADFDEDGILRCDPSNSYDHCVVLLGWDETEEYWIAKNSGGGDWGPDGNGYFKVGFGDCLIEYQAYGATLSNPDTDKFYIKNSSGETVAWFGNRGNLVLKGILAGADPLEEDPAHDEFRVQDSEGNDVAIIDETNGNMYISGLHKNWHTPSEGKDEFIIRNSSDEPVAFISDEGDLYLTGKLYQNPE